MNEIQGTTGERFLTRLESGQPRRTTTLSLRTVAELRSMTFDDSDCYLGDQMLAAGQPTSFLGPGGIGKSRMVLQLAVCCILGVPFLGLETHAFGRRWLIHQTENSNRRIRADLEKLITGLELSDECLCLLNRGLIFHPIERDHDALLDLGDPEIAENVAAAVFDTEPDFVVLDPLNTFTSGDLNSDRDCRAVITAISSLIKRGDPERVPFVVHHSLTGKAGASRAVGWDRGSYGRNSKVLHAWVRSQWNLAPADPNDETKLILACGKNNNGRPFEEIGVVFDEAAGIYRIPDRRGIRCGRLPGAHRRRWRETPERPAVFAGGYSRRHVRGEIDARRRHPAGLLRAIRGQPAAILQSLGAVEGDEPGGAGGEWGMEAGQKKPSI